MRTAAVLAVACLSIIGLCRANESNAAAKHYNLNIPEQPLDTALKDLAQQTGLQIARFSDVVAGNARVGPLSGDYSLEQALNFLLAAQDLTFKIVNDRTIAIIKHEGETERSPAKIPLSSGSDSSQAQNLRLAQATVNADTAQARSRDSSNPPSAAPDVENPALEEVVVTGTAAGSGV